MSEVHVSRSQRFCMRVLVKLSPVSTSNCTPILLLPRLDRFFLSDRYSLKHSNLCPLMSCVLHVKPFRDSRNMHLLDIKTSEIKLELTTAKFIPVYSKSSNLNSCFTPKAAWRQTLSNLLLMVKPSFQLLQRPYCQLTFAVFLLSVFASGRAITLSCFFIRLDIVYIPHSINVLDRCMFLEWDTCILLSVHQQQGYIRRNVSSEDHGVHLNKISL